MKDKVILSLGFIFISLFISSCSKTSKQNLDDIKPGIFKQHLYKEESLLKFNISCEEKKAKKLVCSKTHRKLKHAKRGNSWEGKWIFSVTNSERDLYPGTIIRKGKLDPKSGLIKSGARKLNPATIPPSRLVYIGFTSLSQGPDVIEGYDIISNFNNKLMYLSDIKASGNNLSWSLKYEGDSSEKVFSQGMEYKTKAKYIPEQDILIGQTEFGMNMTASIVEMKDKELKVKEESKTAYIPMGSYIWRATRLDETAFTTLTKPGYYNWQLPMYLVGIDTKHKEVEKYLYN